MKWQIWHNITLVVPCHLCCIKIFCFIFIFSSHGQPTSPSASYTHGHTTAKLLLPTHQTTTHHATNCLCEREIKEEGVRDWGSRHCKAPPSQPIDCQIHHLHTRKQYTHNPITITKPKLHQYHSQHQIQLPNPIWPHIVKLATTTQLSFSIHSSPFSLGKSIHTEHPNTKLPKPHTAAFLLNNFIHRSVAATKSYPQQWHWHHMATLKPTLPNRFMPKHYQQSPICHMSPLCYAKPPKPTHWTDPRPYPNHLLKSPNFCCLLQKSPHSSACFSQQTLKTHSLPTHNTSTHQGLPN